MGFSTEAVGDLLPKTLPLGLHDGISTHQSPAGSAVECDPVQDYFDPRAAGVESMRSETISMQHPFNPTIAALTALQYLPVPVLVLSSMQSVVLANEAMGRLLGTPVTNMVEDGDKGPTTVLSVSDLLHGKTLDELGITMLQNGSPIWVGWDVGFSYYNTTLPIAHYAFGDRATRHSVLDLATRGALGASGFWHGIV